ncbi:MAG: hypothetical protein ACYTFA_16435, partial [Planctomycetota bacterium]
YGRRLVNVYAFGSFPEGYELAESDVRTIPRMSIDQGIGPVEREGTSQSPEQPETEQERGSGD